MTSPKESAWLSHQDAAPIYQKYEAHPLLRDTFVAQIRQAWGNPYHPLLTSYLDVERQDQHITYPGHARPIKATVLTPKKCLPHRTFIYLHGGSWMAGLSGKHLAWAMDIAQRAQITVVAVEYCLAPEFPFPEGLLDCVAVYQHYRTHKPNHTIFVGGDSAGGNLGAALCCYAADHNLPMPDGLLALSPMMDLHMEKYPSVAHYGVGNPVADMSLLYFQRSCYLPDPQQWQNPYASPLYGDLTTFPPTLVVCGTADALYDDNRAFMDRCRQAEVTLHTHIAKDMPHSFFTQMEVIPKIAGQANNKIATFLQEV